MLPQAVSPSGWELTGWRLYDVSVIGNSIQGCARPPPRTLVACVRACVLVHARMHDSVCAWLLPSGPTGYSGALPRVAAPYRRRSLSFCRSRRHGPNIVSFPDGTKIEYNMPTMLVTPHAAARISLTHRLPGQSKPSVCPSRGTEGTTGVGWPRSPNSASGFATELPPLPQALLRLYIVRCCVPHDVQRTARIIRRYAFKPRHAPYAPRGRRALGLSRRICRPLCALSGACDSVQVVGLAWGERVMHIIGSMTFKDEKNDLSLTLEVMSRPARYSMWHGPCLCTCCELGTAPAHPVTPLPLCY